MANMWDVQANPITSHDTSKKKKKWNEKKRDVGGNQREDGMLASVSMHPCQVERKEYVGWYIAYLSIGEPITMREEY